MVRVFLENSLKQIEYITKEVKMNRLPRYTLYEMQMIMKASVKYFEKEEKKISEGEISFPLQSRKHAIQILEISNKIDFMKLGTTISAVDGTDNQRTEDFNFALMRVEEKLNKEMSLFLDSLYKFFFLENKEGRLSEEYVPKVEIPQRYKALQSLI